jgi:transketolase
MGRAMTTDVIDAIRFLAADVVERAGSGHPGTPMAAEASSTTGAMAVHQPIWEYDPQVHAEDLSARLVFGLAMGAAFRTLSIR